MMVGSGYVAREMCDGQSLSSQGRWPVDMRRYPHSPLWNSISSKYRSSLRYMVHRNSSLSLHWVRYFSARSAPQTCEALKAEVVFGTSIDFNFFVTSSPSLRRPRSPSGRFRLRSSSGSLPSLPALYAPKRKWRLSQQTDAEDNLEPQADGDTVRVIEVMETKRAGSK